MAVPPRKSCNPNPPAAFVCSLAAVLVSLSPTRADTVYLRSGERLIGKVITDEKTQLVIESQTLGRLKIPRDRIERVELDPAPAASPSPSSTAAPFIPPPPVVADPSAPPSGATNAPARNRWFWKSKAPADDASTDWIQLKSGEWLRGKLYGMQNRELDFESDELDDLSFEWKDVHQVISPRALVSYGDREAAWGSLRVDREKVTVTGAEEVSFPRFDLVGIAPGSPRELDYWSGRLNVGVNLRAGNTEQADLVTKAKLERRTPNTHLEFDYVGNFSQLDGVENVNNQRVSETFDFFLTRRMFLRVPQAEFYRDPFQNIDRRLTVGGGLGYYLIDKPKVEWLVAGGPAYQYIRFDTVEPGEAEEESTPALVLQSGLEIELSKRIDFELDYNLIVASEASGGATHHATTTLEIDLTRRLDLDLSFIWDRIGNPQPDSSGLVPKKDDFRLNLSLGLKF